MTVSICISNIWIIRTRAGDVSGERIADENFAGFKCPACNTDVELDEKLHICDNCGVAYHAECWNRVGKCTNPYCSEATSDASVAMAHDIYQERSGNNIQADSINDHLLEAVLATVFCCIPFGIVAIYYASQASTKKKYKDYQGALQSANSAQRWIILSIIGCVVDIVLYISLQMFMYRL